MPYSDPLMDGPVIQHAADHGARAGGSRVDDVFRAARAVRDAGGAAARHDLLEPRRCATASTGSPPTSPPPAAPGSSPPTSSPTRPASGSRPATRTASTGSSSSRPLDPRAARQGHRRPAAASSTPPRTMGVTGARTSVGDARRGPRRAHPGRDRPARSASGSASPPATRPPRSAAYADGVIVGSALVRSLTGAGELGDRLDALRALTAELADGVRTERDEHGDGRRDPGVAEEQPSAGRERLLDVIGLVAAALPRRGARLRRRREGRPAADRPSGPCRPTSCFPYEPRRLHRATRCRSSRSSLGRAARARPVHPAGRRSPSTLLMVAFIVGISQAWARGLTIDCGCFGGGGQIGAAETQYPQEIARDVGLRPRRGLARGRRPRTLASLDRTCSATEGDPEPPWPRSRTTPPASDARRPRSRPPRSPPGSGANKIVVGAVVVVVAIIAVVGGVIWIEQNKQGASPAAATRCPPGVAAMGAGYPAFQRRHAAAGAPTRRPLRGLPVPGLRPVRGAARPHRPGAGRRTGKIKLVYHVMNFLDDNLRNDSSTRAANAAFCAADAGQVPGVPRHDLRRASPRGGRRLHRRRSSRRFAETGRHHRRGADHVAAAAYDAGTYDDYVDSVERGSLRPTACSGTPTVKLDGKDVDLDAIAIARAAQPQADRGTPRK